MIAAVIVLFLLRVEQLTVNLLIIIYFLMLSTPGSQVTILGRHLTAPTRPDWISKQNGHE